MISSPPSRSKVSSTGLAQLLLLTCACAGARAYYLRNILHDWPDNKCIEILQSIKAGMTSESKILIDEMVLPERGAPWRATQLDMAMSSCFAAVERSRAAWEDLLDKAGLKIMKVCRYTEQLDDCVIVVAP